MRNLAHRRPEPSAASQAQPEPLAPGQPVAVPAQLHKRQAVELVELLVVPQLPVELVELVVQPVAVVPQLLDQDYLVVQDSS